MKRSSSTSFGTTSSDSTSTHTSTPTSRSLNRTRQRGTHSRTKSSTILHFEDVDYTTYHHGSKSYHQEQNHLSKKKFISKFKAYLKSGLEDIRIKYLICYQKYPSHTLMYKLTQVPEYKNDRKKSLELLIHEISKLPHKSDDDHVFAAYYVACLHGFSHTSDESLYFCGSSESLDSFDLNSEGSSASNHSEPNTISSEDQELFKYLSQVYDHAQTDQLKYLVAFALAELYRCGRGVSRDYTRAYHYYSLCGPNPTAHLMLGIMSVLGIDEHSENNPSNYSKAESYFFKAKSDSRSNKFLKRIMTLRQLESDSPS